MVHDSVGSWSVLRSVLRAIKKRHVVQATTRKDVQLQYGRTWEFLIFEFGPHVCTQRLRLNGMGRDGTGGRTGREDTGLGGTG